MSDTYLWPTITQQALIASGWFPERCIGTDSWYTQLTEDGYHWNECAQEFLASFGGLSIHPIQAPEAVFNSSMFVVEPTLTLGEYERIQTRETILGETLCPLGEWGGESMILCGPSRRIYAETTYHVLLLGNTPREAIDVIVRGHRYPELITGTVWWVE